MFGSGPFEAALIGCTVSMWRANLLCDEQWEVVVHRHLPRQGSYEAVGPRIILEYSGSRATVESVRAEQCKIVVTCEKPAVDVFFIYELYKKKMLMYLVGGGNGATAVNRLLDFAAFFMQPCFFPGLVTN